LEFHVPVGAPFRARQRLFAWLVAPKWALLRENPTWAETKKEPRGSFFKASNRLTGAAGRAAWLRANRNTRRGPRSAGR
jgi:hypothetical protein